MLLLIAGTRVVRSLSWENKEALFVAYTGLHANASKTLNNVITTLQAQAVLDLAPQKSMKQISG